MANVAVSFHTVDDQPTPVPIDGVLIQVFSATNVYVTQGTTGTVTPGQLDLVLPGNTPGIQYIVRLFKTGVSFPASNQFTVIVTDPPAPPNDFSFTGHVGMAGMFVQLVCQDDAQPTPNPVEGVKLRLFDQADLFLTEFETDVVGLVNPILQGAPTLGQKYIVRLFPPPGGLVPAGLTQEIYVIDPLGVGQTNTFDFEITHRVVPVTGDPLMCRLTGYFIDGARRPLRGVSLAFRPREGYPVNIPSGFPFNGEPSVIGESVIASEAVVYTDSNGYVDIVLPRRSVYDVFIAGMDEPFTNPIANIWVPDIDGVLITDVIYPYVQKVTYGTAAINVAVQSTVNVDVTVVMSNLQENVNGHDPLAILLLFVAEDPTIAEVMITNDGKIGVKGLASGITNLLVSRIVGSYAHRIPAVPNITILPSIPVITVT